MKKNLIPITAINALPSMMWLVLFVILNSINLNAQIKVPFTQRTSQITPDKKIYSIKGDFTMIGNTNLTPQNYSNTTNNNGQYMTYVDVDNDPETWNSSSANLTFSTENQANPDCSEIIFAGLYWTGKSANTNTFIATKQIPNGTQLINTNLNIVHNQNILNSNFTMGITTNELSPADRSPIYTFSGNGNTYAFYFTNNALTSVQLSVNGAATVSLPVTINTIDNVSTANFTTPYIIVDGTLNLSIVNLIRNTTSDLSAVEIQNSAKAELHVSGTIPAFTTLSKSYDKRMISLKGPNATTYTQFTAAESDIYYPNFSDGNIYSSYKEITEYVKQNGIGTYFAADIALLEGDNPGTGYSGGWGIIVVYENHKMKNRDVTIFDGYAYVSSSNTTGYTLPVSGFNTVQNGNVEMKLGLIASEGDVSYIGDYFQIQKNSDADFLSLSHSNNSSTNFFNSSIQTANCVRNPSLQNNTGIDISMFKVPNPNNSVIANNQTATNFRYGTTADTYSIFAIAMSVDSYIPEVEALLTVQNWNGNPVTTVPAAVLPGDEIEYKVVVKNPGTEALNQSKFIIEIPYTATLVEGSLTKNIYFNENPAPNNYYFDSTLGPNGSIVWDLGTLPMPNSPSVVLADFSFKLKATQNCEVIKNVICNPNIAVSGVLSGTGAITGVNFNTVPFITGYTESGPCQGKPDRHPLIIPIYTTDFVTQNCPNISAAIEFNFCTANSSISVSEIASEFPVGTKFYNQYPLTANSIEFNVSNPFPSTLGVTTFYAVPNASNNGCFLTFNLNITTLTAAATTTNITYCQGTTVQPLSALTANPNHILLYYTSLDGVAQTTLIPDTNTIGETTYYVAEAATLNCVGPKIPLLVKIIGKPTVQVPANKTIQGCSTLDLIDLPYSESVVVINLDQFVAIGGSITATDTSYSLSYADTKMSESPLVVSRNFTVQSPCGNSVYNQLITIDDNEAPQIPVLENIIGSCSITFSAPIATDGCMGQIIGTTTDELSYTTQGQHDVTWTFDDGNGNLSTVIQHGTVTNSVESIKIQSNLADCNIDNGVFIDLMQFLPDGFSTEGFWQDIDETNGLEGTVFSPYQIPVGDYIFKYVLPLGECNSTVELTMTVGEDCKVLPCGNIIVHNAFSPNGDSFNEVFEIENIEDFDCYPTNSVEIYNRWGVLVYQTKQYDNNSRAFRGISENNGTINSAAGLPTGTYFYILQYTTSEGKTNNKEGYVYLSK